MLSMIAARSMARAVCARQAVSAISARSMASAASAEAARKKVHKALDGEIEHETNGANENESLADLTARIKTDTGFNVEHTLGNSLVKFSKDLGDGAKLSLSFHLLGDPEEYQSYNEETEEGENENDDAEPIPAIYVQGELFRGSDKVIFSKVAQPDDFEAVEDEPITVVPSSFDIMSGNQTRYLGPPLRDLDPNLQSALNNYFKNLGINSKLSEYITQYHAIGEQHEYVNLLKSLRRVL